MASMTADRCASCRGARARSASRRAVAAVGLRACADGDDTALSERQAEIARRGAEVMPFELDATRHRLEPTGTGLVQTVVAHDPQRS